MDEKIWLCPLDKGYFGVIYLHCHSTVINNFKSVLITLLTITTRCISGISIKLL